MDDRNWWLISTLIRCEDDECGGFSFEHELEQNDWKCPHCEKPISKPE